MKQIFKNVFNQGNRIFTKNLVKGQKVYDEKLIEKKGIEYREWNPKRSKLAAAIMKDISQIGIKPDQKVLYLGAASGTTVSHVSDIVGNGGMVFAIEFSPQPLRKLVFLTEKRKNIIPILADANHPERYFPYLSQVDVVFQDIAQRMQAEIFLKNCKVYLKKGGFGLISVKSRSIDVTKRPDLVFKEVKSKLEKEVNIVDKRNLKPYEKDHMLFVVKKR